MHIAIDASRAVSKNWGGPENYSYYLIRALGEVDSKNKYTLYVNAHPPRALTRNPNFEIKHIPLPRLWTQVGLALESFFTPADILFIPAHTIPFLRRPSIKTVVTIHDLAAEYLEDFYRFPGRLYLNKLTEYCAHHATRIIAVSNSTKNDLIRLLGIDERRIRVIYEGYDKELFKPSSEKEIQAVKDRYKIEGSYILFVGTIQPRKNLVRLIDAFCRLLRTTIIKEPKANLKLVLVGKRGWLCDEIYAKPRKLGIENQVLFLGHIPDDDLAVLLSGAVVLAYPSLYEGFGLVILEAMACGTAVVTSKVSSLPEASGGVAVLVDPYSVDEICQALRKVLEDKDLRLKLQWKGLNWAKNFSWKRTAGETIRVFEEIMANNERKTVNLN